MKVGGIIRRAHYSRMRSKTPSKHDSMNTLNLAHQVQDCKNLLVGSSRFFHHRGGLLKPSEVGFREIREDLFRARQAIADFGHVTLGHCALPYCREKMALRLQQPSTLFASGGIQAEVGERCPVFHPRRFYVRVQQCLSEILMCIVDAATYCRHAAAKRKRQSGIGLLKLGRFIPERDYARIVETAKLIAVEDERINAFADLFAACLGNLSLHAYPTSPC